MNKKTKFQFKHYDYKNTCAEEHIKITTWTDYYYTKSMAFDYDTVYIDYVSNFTDSALLNTVTIPISNFTTTYYDSSATNTAIYTAAQPAYTYAASITTSN